MGLRHQIVCLVQLGVILYRAQNQSFSH
jgi:hypothetical protein